MLSSHCIECTDGACYHAAESLPIEYIKINSYASWCTYLYSLENIVIESLLGSKIMHLFIWDETFVRWQ